MQNAFNMCLICSSFWWFCFCFRQFLASPPNEKWRSLNDYLDRKFKKSANILQNVPRIGAKLDAKPPLGGHRGGLGVIWQGLGVPCGPRVRIRSHFGPQMAPKWDPRGSQSLPKIIKNRYLFLHCFSITFLRCFGGPRAAFQELFGTRFKVFS